MKSIIEFLIFTVLLGTTPEVATGVPRAIALYSHRLERLDNFSQLHTNSFLGSDSLWVVFQPYCASCESQLRDLACLPTSVKKVALGYAGTRDQLSTALKFSAFDGARLVASSELEKLLNLEATPTILIVDRRGLVVNRFQGQVECRKLLDLLTQNKVQSH